MGFAAWIGLVAVLLPYSENFCYFILLFFSPLHGTCWFIRPLGNVDANAFISCKGRQGLLARYQLIMNQKARSPTRIHSLTRGTDRNMYDAVFKAIQGLGLCTIGIEFV